MITTNGHLVHKYDSPSGLVSFVVFQVDETFDFQEGQFVMLESEINGDMIKKPYSIATTSKDMEDAKHIGFVVKKTSDDGMSNFLTQKISLTDTVSIKGPVGHYTDSESQSNYLLISTGSGLSPNVGLFKHLVLETSKAKKCINIFGEKAYVDIVPELQDLFTSHGKPDITNIFHLSREELPSDNLGLKSKVVERVVEYRPGHVQDSLPEAIQILGTETSCFICGAPEMVEDVRNILESLGVDKEDITFEKY